MNCYENGTEGVFNNPSFFILNGYEQQIELSILRTGEYLHFFFFQVIKKKSMNSFVYTYFNEISKY